MKLLPFQTFLMLAASVLSQTAGQAQTQSLTAFGSAYTQDFDTLANTGTTNSALPTGWQLVETGTSARNNQQYAADDGGSNTGDVYSYGATGSNERAFGMLRSGTLVPLIGACFSNATGGTITSLAVNYTGEQWRVGTVNRTDQLNFEYATNTSSINSGTYTGVSALNYVAPQNTTTGAKNGNSATFRSAISSTISGLSIPSGQNFCIRWTDVDASGADDGLAVDDFSLTPSGAPASSAPSGISSASPNSVPLGGTTLLTVAVTPGSNPASTGITVAADLSTIGGSAAQAFADDGSGGDVTAGDNIFSYRASIPFNATPGGKSLAVRISDAQSRTGSSSIALTLTVPVLTCGAAKTPINAIQGSGLTSTMTGAVVEVEGVVTGIYQGGTSFGGFYLQEPDNLRDSDPQTSEGIFIFTSTPSVTAGSIVRVRGTVTEFTTSSSSLTELAQVASVTACPANPSAVVTPVDITLPVASATEWERYEGMLVRFPQQLVVTETFNLGRFGEVILAPSVLQIPTQAVAPGAAAIAYEAQNDRSRFTLDDGLNIQNPDPILYPQGGLSASNTLRIGNRVNFSNGVYTPLTGVLDDRFSAYRLQPVGAISFFPQNPRPAAPASVGGRLRIVGANLLNYFTTLGSGNNCGPTSTNSCRGANNATELTRQQNKLVAELTGLNADIIAFSELENNSLNTPISTLVGALNAAAGAGTYSFVDTGAVGTDSIRVGFIYKPASVTPFGNFKVLDVSVDPRAITTLNRPAIAQTFRPTSGAKTDLQYFTVVANHLKSKGSACDSVGDPDTGDGQGNCNLTRIKFAAALIDWMATNPTADPTPATDRKILLIGDFNSYRMEDPLKTMSDVTFSKPGTTTPNANATYRNLVDRILGAAGYSYVFGGEIGSLDHALGSPALDRLVSGITEWHINADEPRVLDYNTEFKSAGQINSLYAPDQYRASDHDPVLLGFNPLAGDVDDNGIVDVNDGNRVRAALGKPLATVDRRLDFDGDGAITFNDYRLWYTRYQAFIK